MKTARGLALSLPPFRGRIDRAWNTASVLQALRACRRMLDRPGTKVLLQSRNTVALVGLSLEPGREQPVVLKEFGLRGVNKLKSLVLPSKAAKAWRGASALVERGIDTPPPIAYLESRKRGFVDRSYFLAGPIDDAREVRFLFRELQGEALDALLRDLGAFLSGCHDRGIIHQDLSDGNILVKRGNRGQSLFFLLDTNRVRTRKRVGPLARMKNLVRLGVPPDKRAFFLEQYAQGKPLPKTLVRWYNFHKALYAGRVSLKKRLRLKKLAGKLGIQ